MVMEFDGGRAEGRTGPTPILLNAIEAIAKSLHRRSHLNPQRSRGLSRNDSAPIFALRADLICAAAAHKPKLNVKAPQLK
jgi:hypothetical protein